MVVTFVGDEDWRDLDGGGEPLRQVGERGDEGAGRGSGQRVTAPVHQHQVTASVLLKPAHLHLGPALFLLEMSVHYML